MRSLAPITLDRAAEVPLGTQLAWALRARIAGGEIARGERLPGARELAAHVGVNVNTVRAVFARLEDEGLLRVVHGSGTFVADAPDPGGGAASHDDAAQLAAAVTSEARRRGIDLRDVAAALYVQPPAEPRGGAARSAPDPDAATRQLLRAEIDRLERSLAELHGAPSASARPLRPVTAGRLLSTAELARLRDDLAAQLAEARAAKPRRPPALEAAPPARREPKPAPRNTTTGRRTGAPSLRWVLGGGARPRTG